MDDDDAVRALAARVLEDEGFVVIEAAGPTEALAVCERQECIDLLLTDVVMPGMNGRELARRVAALRPGLPVLFVSGYDDSLADGGVSVEPFLAKPFSPAVLAARVRELLQR